MTDQDKAEIHSLLTQFHSRLTQVEVGQTNMQMEIKANTLATAAVQQDTSEVLEIVSWIKSSLKFLGALSGVAKWTASIITAVGALWAVYHGGPK